MTAATIGRGTRGDGRRFHGGLGSDALRQVLAHVDANLGQHISLDQLATLIGLSRFHFARQFRVSTGQSPMGYVRRARVERAKGMFRERHTTIAQLAVSLGLADQSHFTRTFGRVIGVSPKSFVEIQTKPAAGHHDLWRLRGARQRTRCSRTSR